VSRFLTGFFSASLLWAALGFAYLKGYIDIDLSALEVENGEEASPDASDPNGRRARRRPRSGRGRRSRPGAGGSRVEDMLTGDDLGGPELRTIDMETASGEGQLTTYEVETGIDGVMPKIRRCLILVADEDPVAGKMIFGMRISGSGRVTRVNLKGPSPLVSGEAGGCLRKALGSIEYRSFDGPDMVIHYPFTIR
jgi:hypothetical protein